MDGLTIGVIVFGILLLVVWLPLLIVSMVRFWKENINHNKCIYPWKKSVKNFTRLPPQPWWR